MKPEMKSSFNQLLITLSILDLCYLIMTVWDYSAIKVFKYEPVVYVYMFPYFWYPVKNILMSWTTFLIMGIATERYLAVCRPWLYRNLEQTHSMMFRVLSYTLPSLALSLLLNIPKFLEARIEYKTFKDAENNETAEPYYAPTELRLDTDYVYYYIHWTRLILTGVGPFLYLSAMNLMIYCRMQRPTTVVQRRSAAAKKAGNLASILLVIVLVFLVSNVPRLIVNLAEFYFQNPENGYFCDPVWWQILISVSHLFLTLNSSLNFLIYCSVGEKFKKIFCKSIRKIKQFSNVNCAGINRVDSEEEEDEGENKNNIPQDNKEMTVCTDVEILEIDRKDKAERNNDLEMKAIETCESTSTVLAYISPVSNFDTLPKAPYLTQYEKEKEPIKEDTDLDTDEPETQRKHVLILSQNPEKIKIIYTSKPEQVQLKQISAD
ncbi:FMRFamide receptor isoform X2 [Eurytemora carolleeae]|uniref:FMRFamide receptor isoform X2 n=1 Tax=Eurytemora carolleeae TaxID=1294199 RepID=UPI000C76185A|nr:FMRFamide receptor isoform X2 [Eurytemora carolleeae]|eukprot:XP_023346387.1 FMRFamide receptor-like isoform X2 [Eurytemora affinis]